MSKGLACLIPNEVFIRYVAHLNNRGIIAAHQGQYKKWLRYYLDFCDKYPVPAANADRVRLFCEKLQEKRQSEAQREEAAHAISLYYEMMRQDQESQSSGNIPRDKILGKEADSLASGSPEQMVPIFQSESRQILSRSGSSQYTEAGYQEKSKSPEWDAVLAAMAAEIKVRHYSRKTLKTYANWSQQAGG